MRAGRGRQAQGHQHARIFTDQQGLGTCGTGSGAIQSAALMDSRYGESSQRQVQAQVSSWLFVVSTRLLRSDRHADAGLFPWLWEWQSGHLQDRLVVPAVASTELAADETDETLRSFEGCKKGSGERKDGDGGKSGH